MKVNLKKIGLINHIESWFFARISKMYKKFMSNEKLWGKLDKNIIINFLYAKNKALRAYLKSHSHWNNKTTKHEHKPTQNVQYLNEENDDILS